jgi:hypothetical protein
MRYITCEIPHDEGYVIPIGDLHFADKAFKKEGYNKLREYIAFLKENENARAFLGGDIFNMAGRNTKTSPFEQRMSVNDEMNGIVDMLMPVKDKLCGAISGNHENRGKNEFDIDLVEVLCSKLGIPYLGYSGVVNYKVRRKKDNEGGQWYENYYIYYHHSTGGGSAMGGALNRTEKLQNIVEGCDMYCSFHSHKLSHAKMIIFKANPRSKKIEERTVDFLTCGGYLSYENSYAERGMMRPVKVGSPLVKLLSNKHEIKCIL